MCGRPLSPLCLPMGLRFPMVLLPINRGNPTSTFSPPMSPTIPAPSQHLLFRMGLGPHVLPALPVLPVLPVPPSPALPALPARHVQHVRHARHAQPAPVLCPPTLSVLTSTSAISLYLRPSPLRLPPPALTPISPSLISCAPQSSALMLKGLLSPTSRFPHRH